MVDLTAMFQATGWSFAAGPEYMTEITASVDCRDVREHSLDAIAQTLLCFPRVELTHAAEPSWQEWRARWKEGENLLEFRLQPFFEDIWLSTPLQGCCTLGHALALWTHLLSRHRGIWLCERGLEDVYLHTPVSFLKRHAL